MTAGLKAPDKLEGDVLKEHYIWDSRRTPSPPEKGQNRTGEITALVWRQERTQYTERVKGVFIFKCMWVWLRQMMSSWGIVFPLFGDSIQISFIYVHILRSVYSNRFPNDPVFIVSPHISFHTSILFPSPCNPPSPASLWVSLWLYILYFISPSLGVHLLPPGPFLHT